MPYDIFWALKFGEKYISGNKHLGKLTFWERDILGNGYWTFREIGILGHEHTYTYTYTYTYTHILVTISLNSYTTNL